jgi:hypothetical protein
MATVIMDNAKAFKAGTPRQEIDRMDWIHHRWCIGMVRESSRLIGRHPEKRQPIADVNAFSERFTLGTDVTSF